MMIKLSLALGICAGVLFGQTVEVRPAPEVRFPSPSDSNSPSHWWEGRFYLYTSPAYMPLRAEGADQFSLGEPQSVLVTGETLPPEPFWIESTWVDEDGTVFGWYHNEIFVCGEDSKLTTPRIGALISEDGGHTFRDLGIVAESGATPDCSTPNRYFAGGHGDFTVTRHGDYFYFLFGNYGGPGESQGVSIARMEAGRRREPVGAVMKYFEGSWDEPGLGGRVSPVLPSASAWNSEQVDSFWGPAVHWNTHLGKWVMLLNRTVEHDWTQDAIFVSFSSDISDPLSWSRPKEVLRHDQWYPQVVGVGPGESDKVAGRVARLYIRGESAWELVFEPEAAEEPESNR